MNDPQRIILVSCVGRKGPHPMPARELYASSWFAKARRVADKYAPAGWWILSAEFGLVNSKAVIQPYERTLKKMNSHQRLEWAQRVHRSLVPLLRKRAIVCFLAGSHYRKHLSEMLARDGVVVLAPMSSMGIGKQLQWMERASDGLVDPFAQA